MDKVSRNFWLKIIVYLTYLFAVGSAYAWEENTDRPGMNYKNFDLSDAEPKLCEDACMKDPACRAWTYVKPGVQSRAARCWLKKEVPPAKTNSCCVSGIRQVRTLETSKRVLEPQTSQPPSDSSCSKLSFTTTSPLPSAVLGGDYTYQIETSGGKPPISFCPGYLDEKGTGYIKCSTPTATMPLPTEMPIGLTLSKTGLISGQLNCMFVNDKKVCPKVGYQFILIKAWDSCSSGSQTITKNFYIDIKATP